MLRSPHNYRFGFRNRLEVGKADLTQRGRWDARGFTSRHELQSKDG
jgi:hypothetical protein